MHDDTVAAWVGLVLFVVSIAATCLVMDFRKERSHESLGSKGYACFANKTCRTGLKCVTADGLQEPGICVKP
jgi:hypothetical protein